MTPRELKDRTKKSSDAVVIFCVPLLKRSGTQDIARQLLRSSSSVDANYGSAQRARSHDEFTSRIGTVFDEAAESLDWLEKLRDTKLVQPSATFTSLLQESSELTKIFASSYNTAKETQLRRRAARRRGRSPMPNAEATDAPRRSTKRKRHADRWSSD